jgi:hypothetical protein
MESKRFYQEQKQPCGHFNNIDDGFHQTISFESFHYPKTVEEKLVSIWLTLRHSVPVSSEWVVLKDPV